MDEKISLNHINLIETSFVASSGGTLLSNLAQKHLPNASLLELKRPAKLRLFRFIQREIIFLRLPKSTSLLILSAFGPIFRPRYRTYLYFQNVHLLESETLKSSLYQKYLRRFQNWEECYVVVQNEWILEKYSIFRKKKCIVKPFPQEHLDSTPYYIYPTSAQKYKNNKELVEAFIKTDVSARLLLTVSHSGIDINDERVLFIGNVHHAVLLELYRNAKAVFLCSDYESYSYPLYEAISLKKDIIAKDSEYAKNVSDSIRLFDTWEDFIQIVNNIK